MSRKQHQHIIIAPMSSAQKEYARESRAGLLGSKIGEDGNLAPQFRSTFEATNPTRYAARIKPNH